MKATFNITNSNNITVPLSGMHLEDELFTWKVQQGIKNEIAPQRIAAYCQWYWLHHFKHFFKKEEAVLSQVLPEDHHILEKILDEHDAIAVKLEGLRKQPTYDGLERLVQIVKYYVRYEENPLLNEIKSAAPNVQLSIADNPVQPGEDDQSEWQDEFWIVHAN